MVKVLSSKDARDNRPLALAGRILGPLPAALKDKQEWIWKKSSLYQQRRTTHECKQVASRNMIQMEAVSDTALPSGPSTVAHGAQKWAQVGGDCAYQLITSAMET